MGEAAGTRLVWQAAVHRRWHALVRLLDFRAQKRMIFSSKFRQDLTSNSDTQLFVEIIKVEFSPIKYYNMGSELFAHRANLLGFCTLTDSNVFLYIGSFNEISKNWFYAR